MTAYARTVTVLIAAAVAVINEIALLKLPAAKELSLACEPGECALERVLAAYPMFTALAVFSVAAALLAAVLLKRSYAEMKRLREAAVIASQAKNQFLATVSHEIRTPMNAILGITEIQLQSEKLAPDIRDALSRIYNSSDLLLGILNDILDMAKIEAGILELMPEEYDVASLINDTVQLNIMRIGSKPVEFELHVDQDTPAVVVGDALRVKQILNNLLSNACKYTAKGQVRLSVAHETRGGGGSREAPVSGAEHDVMLIFRVSDTGQGMTAEQAAGLFNEYARFHQTANRKTEGTGMGMSITWNLVRLMNGEIAAESEPGRGSTFTVRLPQKNVGSGVLGRAQVNNLRQFRIESAARMQRAQIIREPMPYGRILVVDDVETNIYVAKGLLAPYGMTVDSAESGFAAIEKIRQGKTYDIVFMDHMMPGMDGIDAMKALRGLGYARPVVALTANAVLGQAEMFRQQGFDDFLAKPIDLRRLNSMLNKFVRDVQPPEVIEAARRQGESISGRTDDADPQAPADPKMAAIFMRDAFRSLEVLGTLCEQQGAYTDEDIQKYITNIHGMKSALANIGETELSALASRLEQAGRARDVAVMEAETPAFLHALREVLEKIAPREKTESSGMTDEDRAYLREKLRALQAACAAYDKKAAKDALDVLEQKAWPRPTRELLDIIAGYLLHSKFKAIVSVVDETAVTL